MDFSLTPEQQQIKQMVRDAEEHADEDRKRREAVETRNQLDSLIYQTEKNLSEHGGEIDAAEKSGIETALAEAKTALEGNDGDTMKGAMERLGKAQHKLAEAMYAKAAQRAGGGAAGDGGGPGAGAAGGDAAGKGRDDVVDADFEEVKE